MITKTKRKTNDWYEDCYNYGKVNLISASRYAGKILIAERDREKGLRSIVIDPKTLEILYEQKVSLRKIINFNGLEEKFGERYGYDNAPLEIYLTWRNKVMKK